jgi:uncharacterized protein (TIGR03790 family)
VRPLLTWVVASVCIAPAAALDPKDVYLVVNKDSPESRAVAAHYVAKRGVPKENVVELPLPTTEEMSRKEYDDLLATPLRDAWKDKKDKVKVIAVVYGVPLRIAGTQPTDEEKAKLEGVRAELAEAKKAAAEKPTDLARTTKVALLTEREVTLSHDQSLAAVDSELMHLWWPAYRLARWQVNPLNWQFPESRRKVAPLSVMACRIDGPTPAVVKRMIDDAVETEAVGLKGKVYVDARGIAFDPARPDENGGYGYGAYDESMREMAKLLEKGGLAVTLDDKDACFPDGSCPDAALYCGWYSLANYIGSNTFVKGAVAWHLASSEAVTLHQPGTKLWCANLLKDGACATLGPVAEPFTVGFPKPAEFFGFLATGEYTLVECYAKTLILSSWQMTLIGDPLYNPYKKNPAVKVADVKPSPAKGKFLVR